MHKKVLVTKLLAEQKYSQLINMAHLEHSCILRYIQMHLYHDYHEPMRWYAIEALGRMSREFGYAKQETYRNLLHRLLWSMEYDSGNVPWCAPEAIASIIVNRPGLFGHFVPLLINNSLANPICHQGLFWAICQIGKVNPKLLKPVVDKINYYLYF